MVFESASPTSVKNVADRLREKKQYGCTSLFLGARTGGLFRNQTFYKYLRGYSLLNFNELSEIGKFQECYRVLKEHINEKDTRVILTESLKSIAYREEDALLAELIKAGLFDAIISTNIDSLLEDTFVLKGMRRPNDYLVLNGLDSNRGRLHLQTGCCIMMKVFGDLGSLNYRVPNSDFKLDTKRSLNRFLKNIMLHDVLILGYDPLWDLPLEQAFVTQTGFCYANEDFPLKSSRTADTLEKSKGQYLVGLSCQRFIRELHSHITGQPALAPPRRTAPLPMLEPTLNERRKIFVSYSHKDIRYLRRFRTYMQQYLRNEQDLLKLWDDTEIQGGQLWYREIKKALETTRVAVLLVSANFFASEYIIKHELPLLLAAAEAEEVTLVPVIIGPCALDTSPLHSYQAMNSPSLPLSEIKSHERDKICNRTAEHVYNIVMKDKE